MSPRPHGRHQNRTGTVYLPASGGEGARMDGMVNTRAPSLNVVIRNKPKMLTGLHQKGRSTAWRLILAPSWAPTATGEQRAPNPSVSFTRNTVSPYHSSQEVGTPQGEPTALRVEEGGKSECRRGMKRRRGLTCLDAKAGRLPPGLSPRAHLRHQHREGCK